MSCFNLPEVNAKLTPVNLESITDAEKKAWKRKFDFHVMPSLSSSSYVNIERYQPSYLRRIACIAMTVMITLVLLATLIATLNLHVFNITGISIVVAVLVPIILLCGGMCVLYRISKKVDILSGTVINPFGKRSWAPMPLSFFANKSSGMIHMMDRNGYVDLSTLDSSNSGIALVYYYPESVDARVPMFLFPLLAAPFVVICKMCYNLIRFLVVPFYILFQMLMQSLTNNSTLSECDKFRFKDISREMGRSLANILRAPFYGSASMITVFYGLLNPLSGRLAYSCLERDWNDDVIRSRSIWLICPERNFRFEGGGTRLGLGQFGYYLMGCFQPCALLCFKDGEIVYGIHQSAQYYTDQTLFIYPGISVSSEIDESSSAAES
ncbi:hypothetical protein [Chlamydia avium]|uniref:Uncharacterized protein n=1 Tax=Chlamydia avium 10DC88 TaxID=1229831 RepID=W8JQS4_9CHLA|nr:hypothetical protein [Chlamydia avium]AHK63173.1 Uncharacterized protein M832_03080 [Chlamydia avium 10DC88]